MVEHVDPSSFTVFNPPHPNTAWSGVDEYPTAQQYANADSDGKSAFTDFNPTSGFFTIYGEARNPNEMETIMFGLTNTKDRLIVVRPEGAIPNLKHAFLDSVVLNFRHHITDVSMSSFVIAVDLSEDPSSKLQDAAGRGVEEIPTQSPQPRRFKAPQARCLYPWGGVQIAPSFVIPIYFLDAGGNGVAGDGDDLFTVPKLEFTFSNKNGSRDFLVVKSFSAKRSELIK
ncbi:MAG: hypothetical protein HYT87_04970 [Nitrospirae bacterium]|nr:hypothetical protein [Nitrospirota bacterium]